MPECEISWKVPSKANTSKLQGVLAHLELGPVLEEDLIHLQGQALARPQGAQLREPAALGNAHARRGGAWLSLCILRGTHGVCV